jgi:hypothetical protein
MKQLTLIFLILLSSAFSSSYWGFFGHRMINRHAVFSLPPEMILFYKNNIDYITMQAVAPDKRRYAVKYEAPRHYIDLEEYSDSLLQLPKYWQEAVEKYSEDTLLAYGTVPWHVHFVKYQLTEAFKHHQVDRILKLSAELGHYIADANVPLHTTKNYNGQLTNQHGIHGLWESRLPEMFSMNFDLWIGQAEYIEDTQGAIWEAVFKSHNAVDSVLLLDKAIKAKLSEDRWHSFEQRGAGNVRIFSEEYSVAYHKALDNMVERQLRRSIKMVADFWFTCWVDAGQPDLEEMMSIPSGLSVDSAFVADEVLQESSRGHEH